MGARGLLVTVAVLGVYVALSGILAYANEQMVAGREWPWTWYWLLWAGLFGLPAGVIAVLTGVAAAPPRRMAVVTVGAMSAVLVTMEIAFLADVRLAAVLVLSGSLTAGAFLLFSRAT